MQHQRPELRTAIEPDTRPPLTAEARQEFVEKRRMTLGGRDEIPVDGDLAARLQFERAVAAVSIRLEPALANVRLEAVREHRACERSRRRRMRDQAATHG